MVHDRCDDVSQVDLRGELYGQIREYVCSVCQDDGTQDTLIIRATFPLSRALLYFEYFEYFELEILEISDVVPAVAVCMKRCFV